MKNKLVLLTILPTLILAISFVFFIYFIRLEGQGRTIESINNQIIFKTWAMYHEYRDGSEWEIIRDEIEILLEELDELYHNDVITESTDSIDRLNTLIAAGEYHGEILESLNSIVHEAHLLNIANVEKIRSAQKNIVLIIYWVLPILILLKIITIIQITRSINYDVAVLNKTQAKLRDINGELERFVDFVSHDLREPIRMVSSYLGLLKTDELDQESMEYIKFAIEGAKRSELLIDSLRSCARLNREMEFEEVSIKTDIIEVALRNLGCAIQDVEAVIEVNCSESFGVRCDVTRMIQVIQNLVSNAIKYAKRDQQARVKIDVRIAEHEYYICVTDNGIGISEDDMKKLFVIFKRLHPRDEYPGTGVGLALCKKIVEQHGGKIWVDSISGVGSKFCFTLPFG